MRARPRVARAALLLLCAIPPPLLADDTYPLVGATLAIEAPADAQTENPILLSGGFLARFRIARPLVAEVAVGYRHVSYERLAGTSGEEYALAQVPVQLGLRYLFAPGRGVTLLPGAALVLAPSRLTYDTYRYSTTVHGYVTESGTTSQLVVGGSVTLDAEIDLGRSWCLLAGVGYVFNPVSLPFDVAGSRNYGRLGVGLGYRFGDPSRP